MGDGIFFDIDPAALARAGDRIVRGELRTGRNAVASATKALERRLEAETRSAVPGNLWKAWASQVYPRNGRIARDPVGEVFVNGKAGGRTRGAMAFWSRPGEVRPKTGRFLAVPLPAAGKAKTPAEWENIHNIDLEFVARPGKTALLVARLGRLSAGGSFRRLTIRQLKAGRESKVTVPIFALIRAVPFRNAFAIEPVVAAALDDLVDRFLSAPR